MPFPFIRLSKLWFTLSGLLVTASVIASLAVPLRLGIDFTGGSLLVAQFATPTSAQEISDALATDSELRLGKSVVTPADAAGRYILRFRYLESETEQAQLEELLRKEIGEFQTEQLTTVGPTIGASLKEKAIRALTYVAIAIVLYLAATFRNTRQDTLTKHVLSGATLATLAIITETVVESDSTRWLVFGFVLAAFGFYLVSEIRSRNPSFKYGVCAIIALLHDVMITFGAFVVLGWMAGVEIDSLTITALLAIMGFSVNDTIVVFDRLRENLKFQKAGESLEQVADKSLQQTLARSINTSASVFITLIALFWLGAESIHWFVGALLVGVFVGTYSSIFLATPLLVAWERGR